MQNLPEVEKPFIVQVKVPNGWAAVSRSTNLEACRSTAARYRRSRVQPVEMRAVYYGETTRIFELEDRNERA